MHLEKSTRIIQFLSTPNSSLGGLSLLRHLPLNFASFYAKFYSAVLKIVMIWDGILVKKLCEFILANGGPKWQVTLARCHLFQVENLLPLDMLTIATIAVSIPAFV